MMRRKKGLRIAPGAHLKTAVRFYLTDVSPELRYRLIIRIFRPPHGFWRERFIFAATSRIAPYEGH